MRFFIDFEALQFSNRIISIGCVCENGNTYSSLVKPPKKKDKVTAFITKLTGITNEMLKDAPSADEVFLQLLTFVATNSDNESSEFYCYGNNDKDFIENTTRYMTNSEAIKFANRIKENIIDYSKVVKGVFQIANEISLKKIYTMVKEEEIVQKHDALEDAQMLCEVALNLKEEYTEEEKEKLNNLKVSRDKPSCGKKESKADDIWYSWEGLKHIDRYLAETGADEKEYQYCCIHNGHIIYFNTVRDAALWLIRFGFCPNRSPKNESHVQGIMTRISKKMNTKQLSYNCIWYTKKGMVKK